MQRVIIFAALLAYSAIVHAENEGKVKRQVVEPGHSYGYHYLARYPDVYRSVHYNSLDAVHHEPVVHHAAPVVHEAVPPPAPVVHHHEAYIAPPVVHHHTAYVAHPEPVAPVVHHHTAYVAPPPAPIHHPVHHVHDVLHHRLV